MSKFGNIMVAILVMHGVANGAPDYKNALSKSIIFFEGQRSGSLPPNQRLTWRGDSALTDGSDQHIDLVGGYYDAGDNIKFGFPMAFTTTMLAWSVVEFGDSMGDELLNAKAAIRWATDYFFKATSALPEKMFVQAGDPNADHNCWERPEDMDTSRTVYSVDSLNPGSDVAAETAAAMAAASIVFQTSDPTYSQNLLHAATQIFEFADKYRGAYSDSLKPYVCPFYCDFSGYQDELLWGASWLHRASGNDYYLDYIHSNEKTLGADDNINEFGWDNKHAGLNVLVAKEYLMGNVMFLQSYKSHADSFICSLLPETPASASTVDYTPGGLIYKIGGSNMQHVSSISFLLLVYANYLSASSQSLPCGTISATPQRLRAIARRQMEYILGNNPLHLSYMVGYGDGDGDGDGDGKRFPQRIHHRASSLPSIAEHGEKIACKEGSYWYNTSNPNPNILVGAVVGGPDSNDQFADDRADFRQSEPTTYINAPLVGVLAFFTNY